MLKKPKNYTKDVKRLNMAIKDFEHNSFEIAQKNRSLKYQLELKNDEISNLKSKLSTKDKIIDKLQSEKEKVKYLTDIINNMDIKDKLRLAICMSKSEWSGLIYNSKENYEKFDSMLKNIDEEYRTTLINFENINL